MISHGEKLESHHENYTLVTSKSVSRNVTSNKQLKKPKQQNPRQRKSFAVRGKCLSLNKWYIPVCRSYHPANYTLKLFINLNLNVILIQKETSNVYKTRYTMGEDSCNDLMKK